MIRNFSTSAIRAFQKEGVAQFSSLVKPTPATKKWQPSTGNSFRTFAEYRLRAVNQSPLKLRAQNKGK